MGNDVTFEPNLAGGRAFGTDAAPGARQQEINSLDWHILWIGAVVRAKIEEKTWK